MRPLRLIALVPLLLAASACGTRATPPFSGRDVGVLPNRVFVVTGVTDHGKPVSPVAGTRIRITLSGHGREIRLTAGCNTMSGSYSLDGTRMSVASLASTEMGCAKPLMNQDAWLAGLFDHPVQLTTGQDAAIISGGVVLNLAPREVVLPDAPLAGTRWTLDTIVDRDSASSVAQGSSAWLRIDGDRLRFDLGCTGGTGVVKVVGDKMAFTDVIYQATPCRPADVLYPAFTRTLEGVTAYKIEEKQLTITNGDHALGFRAT